MPIMLRLRRLVAGVLMAAPYSETLNILLSLPKFGRWLKANETDNVFDDKETFYAFLNAELCDGPITYLEFGVYEGWSLKQWVILNQAPESIFVGFDSFEGLPESWNRGAGKVLPKGAFDVQGKLPQINDSRVSFVKGYFNNTLGNFLREFIPRSQLIVHLDADLYSSTLYCLTQLDPLMVSGTIVIFDEFNSVLDEFRALADYAAAYQHTFRVVAKTVHNEQVAIVMN